MHAWSEHTTGSITRLPGSTTSIYSSTVLDVALQWFRFNITLVRATDVVVVSEFLLDLEIAKYDDRQRSTSSTIFVIKVHSLASARFFLAN